MTTAKRGRPSKRIEGQAAVSAIIKQSSKAALLSMCEALGVSQADALDMLIEHGASSLAEYGCTQDNAI